MKRAKKRLIGGIRTRIICLILLTVILLTAGYIAISVVHGRMISRLSDESGRQQQTTIALATGSVMHKVVSENLEHSNRTDVLLADEMFGNVRERVTFLADCATKLFAHPEDYAPQRLGGPVPDKDGTWTANVVYAPGVDPADTAVAEGVGLLGNLSQTMLSLCPAVGASNAYAALPEGVHMTVSDNASGWFEDGKVRDYDPRQREWYQLAVSAGELVITNGEEDANTGEYCIECAAPVYGPDGSLRAVVGADLYLTDIQQIMEASQTEGEYHLLVNQAGRAVLTPQAEAFPMGEADRKGDVRDSKLALLSLVASVALRGNGTGVLEGSLKGGNYFVIGTPIGSTGWALISAYSKKVSEQPTQQLLEGYERTRQDAAKAYRDNTRKSTITAVAMVVEVMLLTLGAALLMSRRIVGPLNRITQRISELSEENLEFKMEDAYRTGDEIEVMAEAFANISHKTVEYMDKVVKVTAEKERIGAELSLANQIQASMLPHIFPPFPDRTEFDIYAVMDPAKEVGGDFYDYFLIDDDHLCLVIADVAGKGVPAALFMMASKIILQSVAMLGHSPAKILASTNDAVCSNNEAQMFVTVWLGILEISTGKLVAANAGHEYPVLRMPGSGYELYKDKHGFVIGGMEGVRFREYEVQLEPGARLFVYTDGVPEATNAEKELFGTERMLAALNIDPDAAPVDVLKNVRVAVDAFVKDAEQFDDLTMLCMEYRGAGSTKVEG